VTETFADVAYGKNLELTCTIPASLPTALVGDAGRLRQIMTNLVGNAIKFTEKGEVGLRVEAVEADTASAFIAFDVTDTGIGIPSDKQRHISMRSRKPTARRPVVTAAPGSGSASPSSCAK